MQTVVRSSNSVVDHLFHLLQQFLAVGTGKVWAVVASAMFARAACGTIAGQTTTVPQFFWFAFLFAVFAVCCIHDLSPVK